METRREIGQDEAPCVLHKFHSPITVVNELHHPFPQYMQKRVWGEVRDDTVVSLCSTGHNSVHAGIRHYEKTGEFPEWCVGKTRDLVEEAFTKYEAAKNEG